MDVKKAFSTDSLVTIQGIGRVQALTSRHGPPYVKRYKNLYREHERREPPDGQGHPPPEENKDRPQKEDGSGGEGFEITI